MSPAKLTPRTDVVSDIAAVLYGDGAWEISKAMGAPAVPAVPTPASERKKRMFTAGLSAVGGAAGAAGLTYAGAKFGSAARKGYKASTATGKLRRIGHGLEAGAKEEPFGTALVPLEVAGLGGEVMSTKILHGDAQKQKKLPTNMNVRKDQTPPVKGRLVQIGVKQGFTAARKTPKVLKGTQQTAVNIKETVTKSVGMTWRGEISKMDTDKKQVFGWASIVEIDGKPVVDLQGDMMTIDTVEKAAYDYVKTSRKGGNQHQRDGEGPKHVSDMIESFLVTDEKKRQMGLPDTIPTGWWVGFQVNDDDTWAEVREGKKTEFSIHGSGVRKELVVED